MGVIIAGPTTPAASSTTANPGRGSAFPQVCWPEQGSTVHSCPSARQGPWLARREILLFEMHDLRGILHSSFGFEGERGGLGGSPIRELSYIMAGSPQSLLCPPPALICDVYFFLSKLMYCSQLKLLPLQHPSAVEVFSCLLSNSPYVA